MCAADTDHKQHNIVRLLERPNWETSSNPTARKTVMQTKTSLNNISTTEQYVRFGVSFAAIVIAIEASLNPGLFAAINFASVALATTAIVGWDPLKSVLGYLKAQFNVDSPRKTAIQGR
jgi:hypothetical protein